jgi:hypothetical protein
MGGELYILIPYKKVKREDNLNSFFISLNMINFLFTLFPYNRSLKNCILSFEFDRMRFD